MRQPQNQSLADDRLGRATLEIETDGTVPGGAVITADGHRFAFSDWTGLAAAIEDWRTTERPPSRGDRRVEASAELVREGDFWTVVYAGYELRVQHSKGMGYLAALVAHPWREITALALASAPPAGELRAVDAASAGLAVRADSDVGPLLDPQAKAAYRQRLTDLVAEREEAERFNDPERAIRARCEYDAVARQLAAAVGHGGRDRRVGSPAERARLNVTRALRTAIDRIARHDQPLGEHLQTAVRTGRVCVYLPDPSAPVAWRVSSAKPRSRLQRRSEFEHIA